MHITYVALFVFLATYVLNLIYISVFYHRGLAHNSVILSPRMKRFVISTGPWVVGLDAISWTCMHRFHHEHADTEADPHSPHFMGIFGLLIGQLVSYKRIIIALIKQKPSYVSVVADIDSQVHWLYRKNLWWLPYLVHLVIAAIFALVFHSLWVGAGYFLGIMSHPIQGWLVNSLAHSKGYRNFNTKDKSVNNLLLAYLIFGEGYQNNHHQYPNSAKFGVRWFELDLGYWICLIGEKLRLFTLNKINVRNSDESLNEINCNEVNDKNNSLVSSKWLRVQVFYSILLFVFISFFLIGCKQDVQVIDAKPKVINWTQIDKEQSEKTYRVMGSIVAAQHSELSFELAGKVTFIHVKEGQFIEKGEVIAQLNDLELLLSYQKQQAIIEQAKALQIEANNEHKRSERLFKEKLISLADLDDARTNHLVASNHLTVTLAQLEIINNNLKKLVLLAPFSGIVARKFIEQEYNVAVGQPIVRLDNEQGFEVEFWLSQRLINQLEIGHVVDIKTRHILKKQLTDLAVITEISQVNKINAMALVTAKLSGKTQNIFNGDSVQVIFSPQANSAKIKTKSAGISAPATAVNISAKQEYSVFKYNDKTKQLAEIVINNVSFEGDSVFFHGQLSRGDIIASSGVSLLRNGQRVQLRRVKK